MTTKLRHCTRHANHHHAGCQPCRDYSRKYRRDRNARVAAGTWPNLLVPVAPVRAHARSLIAAGMRVGDIAADAGLTRGCVNSLTYGATTRCLAASANAVLAVTARPVDGAVVDATGTRRRIHALMRLGWSQADLSNRIGCEETRISLLARRPRVLRTTADRIRDLFEQLHLTEGPSPKAALRAQKRALNPPEAWSDQTIDDPQAKPYDWCRDDVDEVALARVERGLAPWRSLQEQEKAALLRQHYGTVKLGTLANRWNTNTRHLERIVAQYGVAA